MTFKSYISNNLQMDAKDINPFGFTKINLRNKD